MEGVERDDGRVVAVAAYNDGRRALDVVRCDELEVGEKQARSLKSVDTAHRHRH
jgi:hypothetical protein